MSSDLKDKLSNFEATPPDRVWKGIAASLNNDQNLTKKLLEFEAIPHPSVWNKIENLLNQQTAKVVSINKRFKFRYSVAASFLIVAVGITTLLIKSNSEEVPQNAVVTKLDKSNPLNDRTSTQPEV